LSNGEQNGPIDKVGDDKINGFEEIRFHRGIGEEWIDVELFGWGKIGPQSEILLLITKELDLMAMEVVVAKGVKKISHGTALLHFRVVQSGCHLAAIGSG